MTFELCLFLQKYTYVYMNVYYNNNLILKHKKTDLLAIILKDQTQLLLFLFSLLKNFNI